MRIEAKTRTVYLAPTRGRCYLTKRAAAQGEARTLIERKYPTERDERNEYGRVISWGWHWTEDARLCAVHDRLVRRLLSPTTPPKGETE